MKAKLLNLLGLALTLGMLPTSGCCLIMTGTHQRIPVASTPVGATVTTDDGQTIITPGALDLKKNKEYVLTAEYPGRLSQSQELVRKWNNWLWLDLLWDLGIITWPVDFLTSAGYEIYPKTVHFSLIPQGEIQGYKAHTDPRTGKIEVIPKERLKVDERGEPIRDAQGNFIFEPVPE